MSQHMEALAKANVVKAAQTICLAELRAGIITVAEALKDPRADTIKILRLLCAQHRWGPTRANDLLARFYIWPNRVVRDLTPRQKALIVEAIGA